MAQLILDIGNTRTKVAVFRADDLVDQKIFKGSSIEEMEYYINLHGPFESCIISSVVKETDELEEFLAGKFRTIRIRSGMKLPIRNLYKTPETLGNDRLANACGAAKLNPGKSNLIIDIGTCIKYDLLRSDSSYEGGGISPGMLMRYKALSHFTGQLPYFKPNSTFPNLIGQSTEGSIRSGVIHGMIAEIDGIVLRYRELLNDLDVILTGGDHGWFADKLKSPIFVAPNLTITGLKEILDYND